jgi:hypothetical protein
MIIDDLLSSQGIPFRRQHKEGEITMCCPFCIENGESEDTKFRLGINVVTGLGHCYNCGWRNASTLGIARELCRVFGLTMRRRLAKKEKQVEEDIEETDEAPEEVELPEEYEQFSSQPEPDELIARRYLIDRRVSGFQIKRHKIGFASFGRLQNRIIFPVLGPGMRVYGAVARDFTGKSKVKYLNTPGQKLLWNAFRGAEIAILTEGIFDALRVERAFTGDPKYVACSRMGSAITTVQLKQLAGYKTVVIFPDFDVPGIKAIPDLASKCLDFGIQTQVVIPRELDDSDPGQMGQLEILEYVKGAKPWNKSMRMRLRLLAVK